MAGDLGYEAVDAGAEIAAEGVIDIAWDAAGAVAGGAVEIAGEVIGGIAEGI